MSFDTEQNRWPPPDPTGANVRTAYNMHPTKFVGSWTIDQMPKLEELNRKALYTDNFIKLRAVQNRHGNGINALFMDGHVSWQESTNLTLEPLTSYGNSYSTPYQRVWDEMEMNQ